MVDELLPLQTDEQSGLQPDDTRWHSQVVTSSTRGSRRKAFVNLRARKNACAGDTITRTCSRADTEESKRLCGVCALAGQVAEATASGQGVRDLLFPALQRVLALRALKAAAADAGLPAVWHAFRRGTATDMLNGGPPPLAEILLAGGWKSVAFLRYLTRGDLDERAAVDFAFEESDGEA